MTALAELNECCLTLLRNAQKVSAFTLRQSEPDCIAINEITEALDMLADDVRRAQIASREAIRELDK